MSDTTPETAPDPEADRWNYRPDTPLANASIFRWPINLGFLTRWFFRNWLTLSERMMMVILAIALWLWAYPSLEQTREFAFGWVFQVWAINIALMLFVAGGLHWYFYIRKGQKDQLKFDKRPQGKNNKLWSFSDQVLDNMFWTLGPGVLLLTAFQVLIMWAMSNGYAPTLTFADSPVWFVIAIILLPIWSAFHFYWIHRLLHVPFLYKHVHSLHHRNVNIGPWSGMSMHPVELILYHSTLLIHFVAPLHPIHLFYGVIWNGPGAAMTHTGYEDLLIKDKRRLALGTVYHQLHHRYYECNYGNQEMPWDRWFGTYHDGTAEATEATRAHKKRMYS